MKILDESEKEPKIRATLPDYIYNILIGDELDFGINKNRLGNIIFSKYCEEVTDVEKIQKTKFNKLLQFNLTVDNAEIFNDIFLRKKMNNKAEYFRKIFMLYADQPKYKRELLVFEKAEIMINGAIRQKKKLKIKYNQEYRIIEPYLIISSESETRNYVLCFCEKNKEFRNYRITNIKPISIINEKWEHYEENHVNGIIQNFDSYLSFGKKVKVKFTDVGIEMFNLLKVDKPKILSRERNEIEVECSIFKAKLYFSQFLDEVEILEPIELREWFKEKYTKAVSVYC